MNLNDIWQDKLKQMSEMVNTVDINTHASDAMNLIGRTSDGLEKIAKMIDDIKND